MVYTGSGEEMSSQDKIVYQLKQEIASLENTVMLLKSENEQLRSQSLPIKKEEGILNYVHAIMHLLSLIVHFHSSQDRAQRRSCHDDQS